jgi:hypothetical protein
MTPPLTAPPLMTPPLMTLIGYPHLSHLMLCDCYLALSMLPSTPQCCVLTFHLPAHYHVLHTTNLFNLWFADCRMYIQDSACGSFSPLGQRKGFTCRAGRLMMEPIRLLGTCDTPVNMFSMEQVELLCADSVRSALWCGERAGAVW